MKRPHGIKPIVLFGGVCAVLTAGAAWADGNAFVGKWQLNKAQSRIPPGDVMPADMVANFTRVDTTHVRWTITVTDAQGRPSVETFDTPGNGEFYPISADTTAAFTLTGSALQATFKGPAGEMDALTCAVSKDSLKMTCNGVMTAPTGIVQSYIDVYDRK